MNCGGIGNTIINTGITNAIEKIEFRTADPNEPPH
jgi:hypothetical protein